jgi:hypothetical protein
MPRLDRIHFSFFQGRSRVLKNSLKFRKKWSGYFVVCKLQIVTFKKYNKYCIKNENSIDKDEPGVEICLPMEYADTSEIATGKVDNIGIYLRVFVYWDSRGQIFIH